MPNAASVRTKWKVPCAIVVALSCAAVMSACSSSGSTAASTTGTSTSPGLTKAWAEGIISDARKGVFDLPPTSGPKAMPGKHIYYVSYGQQYPTASAFGAYLTAADTALGWKTTIIDGQGDLTDINTGIEDAVTARASAIVTAAVDCPSIKDALLAAKAAHVTVVNYAGLDCNAPTFGSGQSLFTASLKTMGSNEVTSYYGVRGKWLADYILATEVAKGVKNPSILALQNLDQAGHAAGWAAFDSEVKARCPSCALKISTFTVAQVPNPATQNWRTAMLGDPTANAIAFDDGGWLTSGLASDLKAVEKPNQIACCSNTITPLDFQMIRSGKMAATVIWPFEYDAWATADTLNRLFAGETASALPTEGGGFWYLDKTNLPAGPAGVTYPINFQPLFEKVWSGS
jgi:ribose transport system substrate-binding protein